MQKKIKKTLSDRFQATQRTLLSLLGFCAMMLGGMALFVLNHVSLKGYAFQKEAEKREVLLDKISILETKIAGIESRHTLKKSKKIKQMVSKQGKHFMIIEAPIQTAQIEVKNNF